jgi:hypothetical protein
MALKTKKLIRQIFRRILAVIKLVKETFAFVNLEDMPYSVNINYR